MAAHRSKRSHRIDYSQLNNVSSVVLYDTMKKRKTRLYKVERIISHRKIPYDNEYLVKWKGYSLDACMWEPSENLTIDLLRNYENPPISDEKLQAASANFTRAVHSALRSQCTKSVYAEIPLDVWRHVTFGKGIPSEHVGHRLFEKCDLTKLKYLPGNWCYAADEKGSGIEVDFPIKAKPVLSWSPKFYIKGVSGEVTLAKRLPCEKICLTIIRKPFDINNH